MTDTPHEPKATELSDETEPVCAECGDEFTWNEDADRSEKKPYCNLCSQDLAYQFRAEVEALKAERDKLQAAIAWRDMTAEGAMVDAYDRSYHLLGVGAEFHDSSRAGRAAALVRLHLKVTGGEHG